MWQQNYTPIAGSLALSALVAAIPIFVLLLLIGVLRKPAWVSALCGLGAAAVVALAVYGMPVHHLVGAVGYGAAFGLFPIGWVVFTAMLLYYVTLESGKFEVIKNSVGHLTEDRRLQTILIAFAFAAFLEGASGFGTPIAICAAMLAGLGFSPFYAAAICLLADTAPVAFGSLGIPMVTLSATTGLPVGRLSTATAWMLAPLAFILPGYLITVMSGWKGLKGVLPAAIVAGAAFSVTEFLVLDLVGVQLTNIVSALVAIIALLILLKFWRPKDEYVMGDEHGTQAFVAAPRHTTREMLIAWSPYILLVVVVSFWGSRPVQAHLSTYNVLVNWPGLHNLVMRMPPIVGKPSPYPAAYTFQWLAAPGTACFIVAFLASLILGMSPIQFLRVVGKTVRRLIPAEVTMAAVLALAYLMNYSGATGTLGLAFAATGITFAFFSGWLGWLGVFLTGSDTSANALFGTLQTVTATKLGLSPVSMAAANSSGGVMGKMISLASIAVAATAVSMKREEEGRLFRFTIKHSLILTTLVCLLVVFYCYVTPQLIE